MMGLRTMTLGYGQEDVIAAAVDQICKGSNFGRPSRIEMETVGDLIDLIPSAEMVKFAKNGSTVTTAAIKLARAYTGRDLVALCSDHPFFSTTIGRLE
jgi:glutamate-1-semialdehyde 2,1-aminomutase